MAESEDPVRLFVPGSDAPEELRALFDAARQDLPSEARLAAIQARIPRGPLPGAVPPPAATPGIGKLLLGAIGLGIVGAGVWFASRSEPPAPPEPVGVRAPALPPAPPPPPAVEERSAPEPAPPAASSAPPPASKPAAVRAGNEAALLERARRALARDPSLALTLARRHEAEFPNGLLRQEREVIAIEALRRLGRSNEATQRAEDFQQKFPNSAHGRAVERGRAK